MINLINFKKKPENLITILIVDDDEMLLDLLKDYGNPSKSINIIYCSNAIDAIRTVKEKEIHGIFSDVNMMNMKQLDDFLFKKASDIPVYRFSGESKQHLNIRLVKPFTREQYLYAVMGLAGLAKIVKTVA